MRPESHTPIWRHWMTLSLLLIVLVVVGLIVLRPWGSDIGPPTSIPAPAVNTSPEPVIEPLTLYIFANGEASAASINLEHFSPEATLGNPKCLMSHHSGAHGNAAVIC